MLLIDDRAGSEELAKPLRAMGLPVTLERLEFGDVAFIGRGQAGTEVSVGIEFKQLGELVQALRTERLAGHQLPGMRECYDFSYLLIEGPWLYDKSGRLQRRSKMSKALKPLGGSMSISELLKRVFVLHLAGGLNPLWTSSRQDTLSVIRDLYRTWTDKALDEHKSHLAVYTPPAPIYVPVTPASHCAKGIEGIGWPKAHAIARHFKTVEAMVAADEKEWMKVEGIGKELAARAVRALHENHS
jgi:ERCC4-type nuclease